MAVQEKTPSKIIYYLSKNNCYNYLCKSYSYLPSRYSFLLFRSTNDSHYWIGCLIVVPFAIEIKNIKNKGGLLAEFKNRIFRSNALFKYLNGVPFLWSIFYGYVKFLGLLCIWTSYALCSRVWFRAISFLNIIFLILSCGFATVWATSLSVLRLYFYAYFIFSWMIEGLFEKEWMNVPLLTLFGTFYRRLWIEVISVYF